MKNHKIARIENNRIEIVVMIKVMEQYILLEKAKRFVEYLEEDSKW